MSDTSTNCSSIPSGSETKTATTTTTTTVIGIRHATSIANEWMHRPGNCWGDATFSDDPKLQDAGLSEKGWQQVQTLRQSPDLLPSRLHQVATTNNNANNNSNNPSLLQPDEVLVVVSPLTRCLQTWYHGVRPVLLDYFATTSPNDTDTTNHGNNNNSSSSSNNNNNNPKSIATSTSTKLPRTIILPVATERVYTASDHGKTYTELIQTEFAKTADELDWTFVKQLYENDRPAWWYTNQDAQRNKITGEYANEWRPSGQGQYYAVPGEPEHVFEARMRRLEEWLMEHGKGYKVVILVSHWGILHHFTRDHVNNCGVCSWTLTEPSYSKRN